MAPPVRTYTTALGAITNPVGTAIDAATKAAKTYLTPQTPVEVPVGTVQAGATGPITPTGAYNPVTGGTESIMPTTAVNTGIYSPEAKQALWEKAGGVGSANANAFYRKPDGNLGIKEGFFGTVKPEHLETKDTVNAYLNTAQTKTYADYKKEAEALLPTVTAPPEYSETKAYEEARKAQGVQDIESKVSSLDNEIRQLEQQKNEFLTSGASQAWAGDTQGVMEGRMSEAERQWNNRIAQKRQEQFYAQSQLNAKNALIENLIKHQGADYQTAKATFDKNYERSLKANELALSLQQQERTAQEKLRDYARAAVTSLYNAATSGGLDPRRMSEAQKAQIGTLEVQAGLPVGFIQNLYDKNPKTEVITTQHRVGADGKEYIDVILKDQVTGELSKKSQMLGDSAAFAKQQADIAAKKQQVEISKQRAATAAAKKAKGGGGGSSAKALQSAQKSFDNSVATVLEKISSGDMTKDEAINWAAQKNASYFDNIESARKAVASRIK